MSLLQLMQSGSCYMHLSLTVTCTASQAKVSTLTAPLLVTLCHLRAWIRGIGAGLVALRCQPAVAVLRSGNQ